MYRGVGYFYRGVEQVYKGGACVEWSMFRGVWHFSRGGAFIEEWSMFRGVGLS